MNPSFASRGRASTSGAFNRALRSHPLTEKGAAAKAEYVALRDSPGLLCIGPPSPQIITSTVSYLSGIELRDDVVIIRSEFFDVERTVYMDGRGHPENGERTNQGHSVGRWEDGALVVDTTLFADHRSANGTGVPSGAQKHTVERYTLSEDGTRLTIDVFLEDPEYLAEPFEGRVEWSYRPDLQLYRYNCDPASSSRFIIE